MSSLGRNRIRHLVRRVGEAPLSLLATKAQLAARAYAWVPGCAARRARLGPSARVPALGPAFVALGDALRAEIRRAARDDAAYRADLTARVARVLDDGRVPCLGYGDLPVPRGAAWRCDAVSGYAWPDRPFPFVNFLTHGADADVKVPWELSRLQWIVCLAEVAAAEGPEVGGATGGTAGPGGDGARALAALEGVLADWCAHNPLGFGPNWTVAMEVAIRAVNLGLAAALVWPQLSPATRAAAARALYDHLRYIRAFPELSDHNGNHYLLNVTGLVFLEGVVFGGAAAARLRRRPWYAELAAQFGPDGLHVEHAPLYHRLCVEAVLWTLAFAERAGLALSDDAAPLAARCWRALVALEMDGGRLPVLGDSDSGQVVASGGPTRDLCYLRRLLGRERGGAALLRAAAGADSPVLRAVGGRTDAARTAADARRVGPYLRLQAAPFDVTVRAGAHGLFGRASHDHDDNAAPWVVLDGRDFLAESGCYAYTRDPAERVADLASAGHNLVTVAGRLRFPPRAGSISPNVALAPIAQARLDAPAGGVAGDRAACTLVTHWHDVEAGAVRHERTLAVAGGPSAELCVVDRVTLDQTAGVQLVWHLAPGWTATRDGASGVLLRHPSAPDAVHCTVRYTAEAGVEADLAAGALRVEGYRFAEHYGARARAERLVVDALPARAVALVTRFAPAPRAC